MHKVAMAKVAEELTTMRKEVVADKLKERQDKEYVEKGRPYLGFSKRGSKVVVTGDSVRMQKLQANPEALDLIKSFFNGDNENVELKFEKDEEIYIPPFFCPVGDVQNGYHHKNVERFLVVLLNILDSGKVGGSKTANKERNPIPPPWFTDKVGYLNWKNPSYSNIGDNLDIIKGIFEYFNLDINTHCKNLPIEQHEEEEGYAIDNPEDGFEEEYVREEAAWEVDAYEEATMEDVPREDDGRNEAAWEETAREESGREETAREEADREETAREEPARKETAREETAKEETAREETSREETAREDYFREDAARKEIRSEQAKEANIKKVIFQVSVVQDAAFQNSDIEEAIFEMEDGFLEDNMEGVVVEKVVNKESSIRSKRKLDDGEEESLLPCLPSCEKQSSPPKPPGPPGPPGLHASPPGSSGSNIGPPQVTSQLRKKSKRSKQKEKHPDFIYS